ncbi:MAG: nucleoside transporter C-terminal domain-containing protein [Bacteroidota bacterium]
MRATIILWALGFTFIGCALPVLGQSGAAKQDSIRQERLKQALVNSWFIQGYQAKGAVASADIKQGDIFIFTPDLNFRYNLQNLERSVSGSYYRNKDSVFLQLGLADQNQEIDSIRYVVRNGEAALDLYQGEKTVGNALAGAFESRRVEQAYAISFAEDSSLMTLSGPAGTFHLKRLVASTGGINLISILRALLGMAFLLGVAYAFSSNRKRVDWRLVATGIGLQLFLAVMVLKVPGVSWVFEKISAVFVEILGFTEAGVNFLFGDVVLKSTGLIFAFQVLPTIVFFSALMAILYYAGILQKVVYGFAWVMKKTMRLSGAESLAAAGNIFLGQTESPLLIRPYLEKMTRSEIMALMTGGMATIAGSVFAGYVLFLGGTDEVQRLLFAKHLLTASIISAPAALVAAKIMVPETEQVNEDLDVPRDKIGSNLLDAIANGTTDGLKLAVNVGVMLLVFIALIRMVNWGLADQLGEWTNLNTWVAESTDGRYQQFNLQYIFGLLFAPVAWLLGVPSEDLMIVGQLLGEKTIINEFVAYTSMGEAKQIGSFVNYKSIIISTYALCGFANFSSIGIQIGGIGSLAPGQRKTLSELGIKSLIGGTIAAFMTAVLAGLLV